MSIRCPYCGEEIKITGYENGLQEVIARRTLVPKFESRFLDLSCKHRIGKECISCEFWMGIGPEIHPLIYPGEGCAITALIEHKGLTLAEAIEEARRRNKK